MDKTLLQRARETQSAEELLALAKSEGIEITQGQAEEYFMKLHASMELSDEELDNVSGGGCYTKEGYLETTIGYKCEYYEESSTMDLGVEGTCCRCKYWDIKSASQMIYFGQPGICRHPKQMKNYQKEN